MAEIAVFRGFGDDMADIGTDLQITSAQRALARRPFEIAALGGGDGVARHRIHIGCHPRIEIGELRPVEEDRGIEQATIGAAMIGEEKLLLEQARPEGAEHVERHRLGAFLAVHFLARGGRAADRAGALHEIGSGHVRSPVGLAVGRNVTRLCQK